MKNSFYPSHTILRQSIQGEQHFMKLTSDYPSLATILK